MAFSWQRGIKASSQFSLWFHRGYAQFSFAPNSCILLTDAKWGQSIPCSTSQFCNVSWTPITMVYQCPDVSEVNKGKTWTQQKMQSPTVDRKPRSIIPFWLGYTLFPLRRVSVMPFDALLAFKHALEFLKTDCTTSVQIQGLQNGANVFIGKRGIHALEHRFDVWQIQVSWSIFIGYVKSFM